MSTRKYTRYVAPAPNPQSQLLGRLYRTKQGVANPYADFQLTGDEVGAQAYFRAIGEQYLRPTLQDGNPMFPGGVRMDYAGGVNNEPTPPVLSEVKWQKAGDPANGYFPDLTSPGEVGNVDPLSRDTDPELSTSDIKPNWQETVGTRSPGETANKIFTANSLLSTDANRNGQSGANS